MDRRPLRAAKAICMRPASEHGAALARTATSALTCPISAPVAAAAAVPSSLSSSAATASALSSASRGHQGAGRLAAVCR